MALRLFRIPRQFSALSSVTVRSMSQTGQWGEGAGKGGGSGGSIRESGGSFGKREAAMEEQYFRKKQQEQLDALKDSIHDDIKFHKEQIEEHKEAIERHKKKIGTLKDLKDD